MMVGIGFALAVVALFGLGIALAMRRYNRAVRDLEKIRRDNDERRARRHS